jgi:hypothetical protein
MCHKYIGQGAKGKEVFDFLSSFFHTEQLIHSVKSAARRAGQIGQTRKHRQSPSPECAGCSRHKNGFSPVFSVATPSATDDTTPSGRRDPVVPFAPSLVFWRKAMYRLRFAAPLLLVGLLTSGFLPGQDKKGDSKDPIVVTKRLPANFSKLGLTDKQKKEIYRIRGKYAVRLEELQQKLAALKDQEKAEVEKVLTEAQKARLRELQSGGAGKEKSEEVKKP